MQTHRSRTCELVDMPARGGAPGADGSESRPTRGFTLVEMMIVILIVAIVAAMAMARLGDTSITRLRAAAQLLVADLGYAQVESIAHGDDLRIVVFDLVNHRYRIAVTSDPATPISNPVTKSPYNVSFGQGTAHALAGVTIAAVSLGGDSQVQFGAYGQLDQMAAATITLAAQGHTVTVTIDPVTGEAVIGDIQ